MYDQLDSLIPDYEEWEENNKRKKDKNGKRSKRVVWLILGSAVLLYLIFVAAYRTVRWKPLLDAVDGESIKVGDYTVGAYRQDFPSLGGNMYVNHSISDKPMDAYCDADIYPKLFKNEFEIYVNYPYELKNGKSEMRSCMMKLDKNMNYVSGDSESERIYEEYFDEIKEVYRVIKDVWGIADVRDSL